MIIFGVIDIRELRMSASHCIQMFSVHPKNPLYKPKEICIKNISITYFGGG